MSDKPEALLLAGQLESGEPVTGSAAAELRRLHAVNQELIEALKVLVENGGIGPEQMFHDARAAIAKATGSEA